MPVTGRRVWRRGRRGGFLDEDIFSSPVVAAVLPLRVGTGRRARSFSWTRDEFLLRFFVAIELLINVSPT
jgi:hypothetical protein